MAKLKRGVLISLGVLLIGLAVLSLSSLIISSSNKASHTASIVAIFDRTGLITKSIGKGFRDTIDTSSGVDVTLGISSVSFVERLPNTDASHFKSNMNDFKSFVEQDESITLNVEEIKDHITMIIKPQNITFYHPDYGKKDTQIIPQQINFNGYLIGVGTDENITKCKWTVTNGTLPVTLDADDSLPECSETRYIDPNATNTVSITSSGGQSKIRIWNNGMLEVRQASEIVLNLTIFVNATRIDLPDNTLSISFPDFGFSTSRDVTIFG